MLSLSIGGKNHRAPESVLYMSAGDIEQKDYVWALAFSCRPVHLAAKASRVRSKPLSK